MGPTHGHILLITMSSDLVDGHHRANHTNMPIPGGREDQKECGVRGE